jgi:SAM-dependent methyltransferase
LAVRPLEKEANRLSENHQYDLAGVTDRLSKNLLSSHVKADSSTFYSNEKQIQRDAGISTSWWYHERNAIILKQLKRHPPEGVFWEVGSGTGAVAQSLAAHDIDVVCVEPTAAGARLSSSLGIDSIQATLQELSLPSGSLSCVGLFDVIEHLPDPESLVSESARVLRPGGHLYITVPALPLLWSDFDEYEGHTCRFTKSALRGLLNRQGLLVKEISYAFMSLVIPIGLMRVFPYRLGRRGSHNHEADVKRSGGAFSKPFRLFEKLTMGHQPFGSSLIAIAQKINGDLGR